jgi:hypothetical protein
MADYDFHQLSPPDLEVLARDLLQAHWGITFENFKSGKDGGIDLQYAMAQDRIIVQCKHYVRTGLAGLLRDLKKEAIKVRRLQPTRYVLVTSVPLSPADKSAIIAIIGGDVLAPGDVVGQEALNNLLGMYPEIEGKHFKLWLASRTVLDRVLHNASVTQSEFKVRQVYQQARRYVQSDAYPRALRMLAEHRVAILAGPPGVGKTSLADLLLYAHVEKGYNAVLIHRDIKEAQSLFQEGKRQIFYFDDFMGATFLGDRTSSITGNDDRALLEFLAMVRAAPEARFVLTTREHIYAQAMGKSERLRHSDLDDFRVFLRMPDYTIGQKARILYNHLYFSDLPFAYQDELLREDFYLQIIRHQKFNPRIIEWLSSHRQVRDVPVKRYRTFVEELLRDPSEIWKHAYEQEISEAGRSMLLTLFSLAGKAGDVVLRRNFAALHSERARRYSFSTRPEDFQSAIRETKGAFVKPWNADGVEVIDPSVLDLLNAVVRDVPENAADIIAGAASFAQIARIWSFARAENGRQIVLTLAQLGDRIIPAIRRWTMEPRRVKIDKNSWGYRGATFERRLTVVIEMAAQLQDSRFFDLIPPLFDRLLEEWRSERPDINDTVDLLRVMSATQSMADNVALEREAKIKAALLAEIYDGCSSDELRETIAIIGPVANTDASVINTVRGAFDAYRQGYFSNELSECRSREQFDGLIEDLQLFKAELKLGVAVDLLLQQVEEAKAQFEEDESDRADHDYDAWKERHWEEREADRSVSDLFSSLRGDRD